MTIDAIMRTAFACLQSLRLPPIQHNAQMYSRESLNVGERDEDTSSSICDGSDNKSLVYDESDESILLSDESGVDSDSELYNS